MAAKIGIIITPNGVDSITVLNEDWDGRTDAFKLLSIIEHEVKKFEENLLEKIKTANENEN